MWKRQEQKLLSFFRPKVERAEWTAEQLLEGDAGMGEYLKGVDLSEVDKIIAEINQKYNGDLDIAMADVRYSFVSQATAAVYDPQRRDRPEHHRQDRQDRSEPLARYSDLPVHHVSDVHLLDQHRIGLYRFLRYSFRSHLRSRLWYLLTSIGSPEWLKTILADGIGGGIQTVSTFIPVIACLFLALSFLEDSGTWPVPLS